jgi:hypothetical protein
MTVSRASRRLLRVRELKEEQSRLALESALGELNRLTVTLLAAAERDRRGRQLIFTAAETGELADRLAGEEEIRIAARQAKILSARIEFAQREAEALRASYLLQRVERRQVETLIRASEMRDAAESARRGQQELDDWHGSRNFRGKMRTASPQGSESAPSQDQRANGPKLETKADQSLDSFLKAESQFNS